MVDLNTWHDLFEVLLGLRQKLPALRVRCVLAGDHNQLPPVGVGAVFENLCTCGVAPVFELERVYRQEAKSILSTAELYTAKCPTPYWTMKNGFVERVLEPNDPYVIVRRLDAAGATDCGEARNSGSSLARAPGAGDKPGSARDEGRRRALQALMAALVQIEAALREAGVPRDKVQLVTLTNELCYLLSSLWARGSIEEAESLLSRSDAALLRDGSNAARRRHSCSCSRADSLAQNFPWKPGDAVVFKLSSHSYFKNNDEGTIIAPVSKEERSFHASASTECVL